MYRKFINIIIYLIIFSISLYANENNMQEIKRYIEKNRDTQIYQKFCQLYQDKKTTDATILFKNTIDHKNPKRYLDYLYLGDLYVLNKNSSKAMKSYKKSLEINPKFAITYYKLGNVYYPDKQAISMYKKSIELDSKYEDSYYNLAYLLSNHYGDYEKSEIILQKLLKISPKDYQAYMKLGIIYNDKKEYKKAINVLEKSIELNKDYYYAYLNLITTYQEIDKQKMKKWLNITKQLFNKLVKKYPKDYEMLTGYASVYLKEENYQKAKELYENILKKITKDLVVYDCAIGLAHIYYYKYKNHNKALEYLQLVQNNRYFTIENKIFLANLYLSLQNNIEVEKIIESIIPSDNYIINVDMYKLLSKLNRFDEAEQFIKKALELKPNSLYVNLHFVNFLINTGELDNALQRLKSLDMKFPQNMLIKYHLALLFSIQKDQENLTKVFFELEKLVIDENILNKIKNTTNNLELLKIYIEYISQNTKYRQ